MAAAATGSWEGAKRPPQVTAAPDAQPSEDYAEHQRVQEFLQEARDRFRDSANAEDKRRREMLEDMRFRCGHQWDPVIEAARTAQGRPCLTINRTDGFVAHVVNDMRQSRPGIKIDPVADGADEEIAEIRQGLIRHIEVASRADIAYDTAFENMACMGLGYMRVLSVRESGSFDMDLRIEWVANTFSVYEDPAAAKPDWSDGRYKFVVEDISLAEFRRRFGKDKSPAGLNEFKSIGDCQPNWLIGEKIRIAEYFHIEERDDILCEMPDGTTGYMSDLLSEDDRAEWSPEQAAMYWLNTGVVLQTRPEKRPYVMWTLMYGLGILKEKEWPGRYIPIIPVIGNQIEIEGEKILVGMVRYAREPQRMFNYMYSCFVETCALAPRAPFVAEYGQIEEFMDLWKAMNTDPQAVLPYKAKTVDGVLIQPPRRESAEPPIQAFVEGLKLSDQNLKSVFRIFEASLGQRGPQESGVVIDSRKIESDLATYNWSDNFSRALQFLGIVVNDLLQYYYNKPGRIVQIIQEDLTKKPTVFNQAHDKDGEQKIYDLSKGKFSVTVSTGPSFPTMRKEASKSMLELAKFYPQIMQVAGPQIVRAMDWPEKDVIADQMEKAMPPELRTQSDEEKANVAQQIPQMQQQLAQAMDMVKQLTEALHASSDAKELTRMKEEFATLRTEITANSNIAIADLKAGVQQATTLSNEIFEEMKRTRAILEGQMNPGSSANPQQAQPSSSAPASDATNQSPSPAAAQVPPPGANTPAEVGIGG